MRSKNLSVLVEGALMVAISFILSFIKIFEAPYGGSITLGSMVPILFYSFRHGVGPGVLAGAVHGMLQFILEPVVYHPFQVILDYPLAFGVLGLAGLLKHNVFLGTTLGIFSRFVCHFLSGVIFFASYAPQGMNPYVYSLLYNGAYLLPELIISVVVLRFALHSFIKRQNFSQKTQS